jgi:hypothetical protein
VAAAVQQAAPTCALRPDSLPRVARGTALRWLSVAALCDAGALRMREKNMTSRPRMLELAAA